MIDSNKYKLVWYADNNKSSHVDPKLGHKYSEYF